MVSPKSTRLYSASCAVITAIAFSCSAPDQLKQHIETAPPSVNSIEKIRNSSKLVYVLVALCDNANQGIVPVSPSLGNGQDPTRNLYWGAAFGVKTFFSKSSLWEKISEIPNPSSNVIERVVFKHKGDGTVMVADAYDGSKMKETIDDFFSAASGNKLENIEIDGTTFQLYSSANLIAFVGHDGLMDFRYEKPIIKKDDDSRDAIILACASKNYFKAPLRQTGAEPLLWTTNLMAPEAYILHDALEGWLKGETGEQVRKRAATAYAKYQRISPQSAAGLFASGW